MPKPSMQKHAHGGNDILNGGDGKQNSMSESAQFGNDTLNGGSGDDKLYGDVIDFVFSLGSGNDVIEDFGHGNSAVGNTATEHDIINVQAYHFADWGALQSKISDDVNGNAVIQLSATDSITLVGVHTTGLHETDFLI